MFVSVLFSLVVHAQSPTVGPVKRARGIKNKDINPVCLCLPLFFSLQGGQTQICQTASEAPLSLQRHALFVRRGWLKQSCFCSVCAAAPICKYLPSLRLSDILAQTVFLFIHLHIYSLGSPVACKPTTVSFRGVT